MRWKQFTIRSLLGLVAVIALLLGWAKYSSDWIAQRNHPPRIGDTQGYTIVGSSTGTAPAFLWLFGEQGYDGIRIVFDGEPTEDELSTRQREVLKTIRSLYPEADVVVMPPYPGTSL